MSETKEHGKHTPGPWYRNIRANGKYPVVFAGRNQYIAMVSQQKDGLETEANIDLIAAAPELLEALKGMVAAYEETDGFYIRYAREAITKAEGRQ